MMLPELNLDDMTGSMRSHSSLQIRFRNGVCRSSHTGSILLCVSGFGVVPDKFLNSGQPWFGRWCCNVSDRSSRRCAGLLVCIPYMPLLRFRGAEIACRVLGEARIFLAGAELWDWIFDRLDAVELP